MSSDKKDAILELLNKNQERMEKAYRKIEKKLESILERFFMYPVSPLQDWFLKITEDPFCCNALGLPLVEKASSQLNLILASESGFSDDIKRAISHRLYETFKILYYIFQHPLCPDSITPYKPSIDILTKLLRDEGYCRTEEIVRPKNSCKYTKWVNRGPYNYNIPAILDAWENGNWERFHFYYTPEPMWLYPNLLLLNYPQVFGKNAMIFDRRHRIRTIFKNFRKRLCEDIKLRKNKERNNKKIEELFVDFSKLLWCIDTFALNSNLLKYKTNKKIFKKLIKELLQRVNTEGLDSCFQINANYLIKMPLNETYKTGDRILLFSAGWALELYQIFRVNEKIKNMNKIRTCIRRLIAIAEKGIERVIKEEIPSHLYLLCQRLCFLLDCWQYKSISISLEYRDSTIVKYENNKRIDNPKKYYVEHRKIAYDKSFFDNLKDREQGKKFEEILMDKIDKPMFLLGGAGIGKTSLVEKFIPAFLEEKCNLEVTTIRVIPIEIQTPRELYIKIKNYNKKTLILFFDEMHLSSSLSPFALMLDPLQERYLAGKPLGEIKIKYIFASSAFQTKEEFLAFAKKNVNIAMRDFATRIHYWIQLPELWQKPEQKFILAYHLLQGKGSIGEEERKKLAAFITIDAESKSSREINRKIEGRINKKEILEKNLKGNAIIRLFSKK